MVIPIFVGQKYLEYKDKQRFKGIDKSKCNQREYIYTVFLELKGSEYLSPFIHYLGVEVKRVYGKWPDEKFLIPDC